MNITMERYKMSWRLEFVDWKFVFLKSVYHISRCMTYAMTYLSSKHVFMSADDDVDMEHTRSSRTFPHSWLITGFVTRLIRRVSLVEQELLTPPEHMSSSPVFSGVRVTRSIVLCICFVDHCSFGHCVVCSSSIYGFWLPLWYLQTLIVISTDDDVDIEHTWSCCINRGWCRYTCCMSRNILVFLECISFCTWIHLQKQIKGIKSVLTMNLLFLFLILTVDFSNT